MSALILASASPRRRDLLAAAGYEFEVVPSAADEVSHGHLSPGEVALFNAAIKARAVARLRPGAVILAVDTLVEFEGRIFGKPADLSAARQMLARLNGREHEVVSGVVAVTPHETRCFVEWTRVFFHRLTPAERDAYLARIAPLDKAGAYAAQDDRGEMIACVEGSFTNVIGLPMEPLVPMLASIGIYPAGAGR